MKTRTLTGIVVLAMLSVLTVRAQEVTVPTLPPAVTGGAVTDYRAAATDSLRLQVDPVFTVPDQTREMPVSHVGYDVPSSSQSATAFRLWKGAAVGVYGGTDHMPGLMDSNVGSVAFYQDFGRLHLSLSANANKYWLPMQSTLLTQYRFGAHASYNAVSWLTLHAFGNYYPGDLRLSPAISPYVFSSSYGGYADVQFGKNFGANLGAQRYMNPMTGRWETEPIVSPYVKFNNGAKLEIPLGHLIKEAIWGKDQPAFGETPVPIMMRPVPRP